MMISDQLLSIHGAKSREVFKKVVITFFSSSLSLSLVLGVVNEPTILSVNSNNS